MKKLILIFALIGYSAFAYELRVVDQGGSYEINIGDAVKTIQKIRLPCTAKSFAPLGNGVCHVEGPSVPKLTQIGTFTNCAAAEKIYNDTCMIKVYDAAATHALVDQGLKGGVDSLTAAVKDSYRLLITSEEFRTIVREEVRKALAERAATE
jgi:hypothetical protein